jgi:hypothetical protein
MPLTDESCHLSLALRTVRVMTIEPGTEVLVKTADGGVLRRRAVSDVERGQDFPVVWVVREEEWVAAQIEGREPDAVPWPAEDVEAAEAAVA